MKTRTIIGAALAVTLGPPLIGLATPASAPAWFRYTEEILLFGNAAMTVLALLAVLVVPSRVLDRLMGQFLWLVSLTEDTLLDASERRSGEIARIQEVFGSAATIVDSDGGDRR